MVQQLWADPVSWDQCDRVSAAISGRGRLRTPTHRSDLRVCHDTALTSVRKQSRMILTMHFPLEVKTDERRKEEVRNKLKSVHVYNGSGQYDYSVLSLLNGMRVCLGNSLL